MHRLVVNINRIDAWAVIRPAKTHGPSVRAFFFVVPLVQRNHISLVNMNHLDPDMDLGESPGYVGGNHRYIGRFRIECSLGRGGMGEVFKAFDPEKMRMVAVKVLDAQGYDDPDTLKRFEREAQAALALDHSNIARFYGTDRDENGKPVIVMEYISGRGLDALLDQEPDLPFSKRVDFVIQAARGLENAYRRSIIHRDIKPGNLLVDGEDHVKIIDFGLAKSMWDNSNLTGTGLVVGTPRYISPEQGMGRNVDHRSDIYSLGATFYELMTGQTPFDGDTPLSIMMKHINTPLMPPYMLNPKVPADISEIIVKMMAKDPGHRYQDYEPLIRDLESAKIHRLSKERRAPGEISAMNTVMLPENMTVDEQRAAASSYLTEGLVNVDVRDDSEPPPSRARLVLLSLAGAAVVVFALLFLLRPTQNGDSETSTLGQGIAGLLSKAKTKVGIDPTAKELAAKDRENVDATRSRMDAVVSRILQMPGSANNAPTVGELRSRNVLTREETQDAWGNDFFITDSTGKATLVAPGRDGLENTADDFRLSLDGSEQQIPEPLDEEAFGKS